MAAEWLAMQCNGTLLMLPAVNQECDMMRRRRNGDLLGSTELAESRHSGMWNANHRLRWQFFRHKTGDPGVRIECATE